MDDRDRHASGLSDDAPGTGTARRRGLSKSQRAVAAAKLAAKLDQGAKLTKAQRSKLEDWTSLAQWIGTPPGAKAVSDIEKVWPGYGPTATGSILNAYYTEPAVVDTVWDWLEHHDVTRGHGFEPGCGRGTWMGAAPAGCSVDGIDIDPISVKIAGLLTGQHTEVARIEEWTVADSTRSDEYGYDFVVGNVPFSANRPGRNNPDGDNLHNLSVLRSAEMLRPGGVAAVITSRYALDATSRRGVDWRRRLHEHVDLVAAFRLPSNTHRSAGTAVVTDLLILRRPNEGEARPEPDWLDTAGFDIDGTVYEHNAHFAVHPERVLGTYVTGGAWGATNFSVISPTPAADALAQRLNTVGVEYRPHGEAPQRVEARFSTPSGRTLPAGSIIVDAASSTGFSRDGVEHKCDKNQRNALAELCAMRNSALEYLDDPSEEGRAELYGQYQSWRENHEPLNAYSVVVGAKGKTRRVYPNIGGFRKDPSWWNVAALETFDDDTHTARPAPMLERDTIGERTVDWPEHAETLTQAVANSMARFHRIDAHYVATQLDVDDPTAAAELSRVAYENPTTGTWEVNAMYLSGDIVDKLDAARQAAAENPQRWQRNVDALNRVMPEPLSPAEIHPEMGVTWLSAADMTQFLHDHTGSSYAEIMYHAPSGKWSSEGYAPGGPAEFRTSRHSMLEQIVGACNAKATTVMTKIEVGGDTREVVDQEATAQEELCRANINEALVGWCWAEPERAQRLADNYNRLFNRHASTDYDGSHLTLPGLAADFTPRPHQKDVVWRILTAADSGTLMAHGVGAGKTAAMVIASQEARRTGRVPGTTMFVVPRNMVEQFARDYLRLYPAARIITPQKSTSDQSVKDSVAEFAARVGTGDFDAAILSHQSFKLIPVSPDVERAGIERRIADYESVPAEGNASRREQRRIENQVQKFRAKLEKVADAADPSITYFDKLPIGQLVVDEAHMAKNVALMTARKGLPMPSASDVAETIMARADLIRERHGDGAVVMATATPITNSPAEMWVFARLVSPTALERAGIEHFDAFAANFLSPVETVEHTADQKLKVVTRLADYRNFPDLARMFRSFADVRETDQLGFDLPELASGQATVHLSPPTDQQLTVTDWASERVAGKHIDLPHGVRDPIVSILHATRAASLHPATISDEICQRWATHGHPNLSFGWDEPNPKLIEAAETIAAIYQRTADHDYDDSTIAGACQAVFCDQGVPKKNGQNSVYSVLTDLCVERGVDREHIAWVHDWPKPDLRQPLWDDVRNGNIRVVLGSTMQMGVGVNIQTRLYAAHELTAPYRPDWLTQAEGRMIRQGNSHPIVELHRYVTEKTADASMWQILERKARFITTAMAHPDTLTRNLRDESQMSTAEEYAQISALATGDQRHIELATVTGLVDRLERSGRAHSASIDTQQRTIVHGGRQITKLEGNIAALDALNPHDPDNLDVAALGMKVAGIRDTRPTEIVLSGVTWTARRSYEGLSLDIDGTGIHEWIDRDRLNPGDGGRGLGTFIVNRHYGIPKRIRDHRDQINQLQRQINTETERPVPEVFPRQGELDEARARKTQLTAELNPTERVEATDTGAEAGVDAQPVSGAALDPVFGDRIPTNSERLEFGGPYRTFHIQTMPHWGNRAKGEQNWVDAVNAHSVDPANFDGKPKQIGQFNGVMLTARCDGNTIDIGPNRHHNRFNTLVVPAGQLTTQKIGRWLHSQHERARAEKLKVQLDDSERNRQRPPDQQRGFER